MYFITVFLFYFFQLGFRTIKTTNFDRKTSATIIKQTTQRETFSDKETKGAFEQYNILLS